MRKLLSSSIAIGGLIATGICVLFLYWMFYPIFPPRDTPCTPISYPDGNPLKVKSTKIYTFETNDPYPEVVNFYQSNLNFDPSLKNKHGSINWTAYPIPQKGVLFMCGALLDGSISELGCIHVREEAGKGIIDLTWSYQVDGPAYSCYMLPGIEPEDYLVVP
jgi:hypothetical protein